MKHIRHWSNTKSLLIFTAIFLVIFLIFEFSPTDIIIQDAFYDFANKHWIVDRDSWWPRFFFYNGIKVVIAAAGLSFLAFFIYSFKNPRFLQWRMKFLYLFLCLAIIPATISSMKSVTNTYCPWDITRYGGDQPYVKAIESYPQGFTQKSKAECFPSGHASGGFALFALCFIARKRKTFLVFMLLALAFGWTMGLYQMLKGAHYLTHNLATMFLSWIMCMTIYLPFANSISNREKS